MRIAEYSYERAMEILNLLSDNKLVTLEVYLNSKYGVNKAKYVIVYSIKEDYTEAEQATIVFPTDPKKLINAVSEFTEFIEKMTLELVSSFSLKYDIRTGAYKVSKSYKSSKEIVAIEEEKKKVTFETLLKDYENYITANGLDKIKLDLYKKVSVPNSKRPRYESVTLGNILSYLGVKKVYTEVESILLEKERKEAYIQKKLEETFREAKEAAKKAAAEAEENEDSTTDTEENTESETPNGENSEADNTSESNEEESSENQEESNSEE